MYLVDGLEPGVVFERLERGAVALPEELEPRRNKCPIRPILALIPADRAEQNTLWRLRRLQIVDVRERIDGDSIWFVAHDRGLRRSQGLAPAGLPARKR